MWGDVGEEDEITGINLFWVVYPFILINVKKTNM